jgi:formylglycine-generating enzyme required for sulfatase activity
MERACFRNNRFNLNNCRLRNIIGLIPFVLLLASMVIFSGNTYKDSSDTVVLVEPYHNAFIPEGSYEDMIFRLSTFNPEMYKLALGKLQENYPQEFKIDEKTLAVLMELQQTKSNLLNRLENKDEQAYHASVMLMKQLDQQLLQNPLLNKKSVIAVKRKIGEHARDAMGGNIGLAPANFSNNAEIWNPSKGWDNEIIMLSFLNGSRYLSTVYTPPAGMIVANPDVHFSGKKMLFASIGTHDKWHIFELDLSTKNARQVTPEDFKDFDSFEPIYTPDGKIIFASTATFLGLPCTDGATKMAGIFLYDPATGKTRQLTFDQDSNWDPVVMNDGRIMYQRWEYADLAHSNSRLLFTMNPDGTNQQSYYGSNSYFPTAFFNARPIPGHPTAVVGIATGHHGTSRSGRMLVIDPTLGRKEAEGVVAEIPYYGRKVEPLVRDRFADGVWPQFLQPLPLNDTWFVVSMKPGPKSLWGLYLVDIFGNMTLIIESENDAYIEPVLAEAVPIPPVIPDRVNPDSNTATIFVQDVYEGGGLKGIPRGEAKKLRVISYGFSPWGQGGLLGTIGMDGPWDIKRVLGTVNIEPDGSAMFVVPANTPIALQPVDSEGKALQLMRSWFTAMPGEILSCIGCHEDKNRAPLAGIRLASRKKPQEIQQWYGKERGFSFAHEVQPVLDRACVSCHNESRPELIYLKGDKRITNWSSQISGSADPSYGGNFSVSYGNLHRYVRRPGIESDLDMLVPMDVHADQTELMQLLQKGHHNVKLTTEEWEKLAAWIDMNAPYHGRRSEISTFNRTETSRMLRKQYAEMFNVMEPDLEVLPPIPSGIIPQHPESISVEKGLDSLSGWPIERRTVENRQIALGVYQETLPLADGVALEMVKIPGGSFIMGSTSNPDEMPMAEQQITPFWMGRFEITNRIYALFDPEHDSRHEHRQGYQFGRRGYPLNHPDQPVVRISWQEAMAFCEWLSQKTGRNFTLPTEAQWEWAARAGTNTPFSFGGLNADYSRYANFGDITLKEFAACTAHKEYESVRIIENPNIFNAWIPMDTVFNDGGFVSEHVGRYRANYFDLNDMHGNVWEWTRSSYLPYPYVDNDGRNNLNAGVKKVARGGSWYDRPHKGTSSYRLPYRSYQKVFNVGFRVVVDE